MLNLSTGIYGNFGCLVQARSGEDIMSVDPTEIKKLLNQYATVVFRGYNLDLEIFKKYSELFSKNFLIHLDPEARPTVGEDRTVTGVVHGNDQLCLHGEMYYLPIRPNILWLYCIQPADVDGETTLCSGNNFLLKLKPKTRELFESKDIKYIHTLTCEQWKTSFDVVTKEQVIDAIRKLGIESEIKFDKNNTLNFEYITSAVLKSSPTNKKIFINSLVLIAKLKERVKTVRVNVEFADGSKISDEVIEEIHQVGEGMAYPIKWQKNDLLAVDNNQVLHGRRAFSGQRNIITRFSMTEPQELNMLKKSS